MNDQVNDGGTSDLIEGQVGLSGGMSLRDYFAGQAFQAILQVYYTDSAVMKTLMANAESNQMGPGQFIGCLSYDHADAMLTAREKGVK